MSGRGLAAGQDGRHLVRLCWAAGRSSDLFLLQAVLAGADLGGTSGESHRHFGGAVAAIGAGAVAQARAGRPDCRLPACALRRAGNLWLGRPDRQPDRAAAPVDPVALRILRR
ncbi:hypothetical protein NDU88_000899 [Pleurodeles waltl]|uniref:Uncharacterized protein n=1 Tax=Pleurodeles waltl TaxID=8319 RepID=A0AAV7VZV2_PLEWA|nr:hypothetical protein NDU88_000899 [Pleurodeles waltl]